MTIHHKESFAIKFSIWGSVITATAGVLAAIYGHSRSLLFDALNTVIGITISSAGLWISKLLKIKYSKRFNFGYYSFEPLFVLANGLLMLGLAVSLFITSIQTILRGGRQIELPVVIQYLIFSVIVCSTQAIILRYFSKKTKSELLRTESTNWLFDTVVSLVVLGAFLNSLWLKNTSFKFIIPYLDPGITIILILVILPQPIKLTKSGLFDLLRAAPPHKIIAEIKEKLMGNKHHYGFSEIEIHAAKIGRTTSIEIICFYNKNFEIGTIEKLDTLGNEIKTEVENFKQNLDVRVTFRNIALR